MRQGWAGGLQDLVRRSDFHSVKIVMEEEEMMNLYLVEMMEW